MLWPEYFEKTRSITWLLMTGIRSQNVNSHGINFIKIHEIMYGLPWMTSFCPWWRHQMETFSMLLAICAGNSPFPAQRPGTRSFDVFFDLRLNNGWVNNGEAGDLRRHCAHYDVTLVQSEGFANESLSNRFMNDQLFFSGKAIHHVDGLVQDCSNSSALAMELLQSCT